MVSATLGHQVTGLTVSGYRDAQEVTMQIEIRTVDAERTTDISNLDMT